MDCVQASAVALRSDADASPSPPIRIQILHKLGPEKAPKVERPIVRWDPGGAQGNRRNGIRIQILHKVGPEKAPKVERPILRWGPGGARSNCRNGIRIQILHKSRPHRGSAPFCSAKQSKPEQNRNGTVRLLWRPPSGFNPCPCLAI